MRKRNLTLLAGLALAFLAVGTAFGATTVINDTFGAVSNNVGFALGEGLNSGINPPTTRLTGTAAANLRYIRRGNKPDTVYWVTGSKAKIQQGSQSGRFTISANGIDPFSFTTALGLATATPATPAVYDVAIKMQNDGTSGRMTFAYGTVEGGGGTWSFGVQIVKSGTQYGVYRRIKTAATGLAAEVNTLTATAGTAGSDISIVMRITDAGAETTGYSSRVQLSVDGGTSYVYDTQTDGALVNGFRFDNANRYVSFDQANNDGADYYDNFSIKIITPAPGIQTRTWTGGGADGNWSTEDNWLGSAVPGTGDLAAFSGTTQQANTNDLGGLTLGGITFSNGGFELYGNPWTTTAAITNLAGVNTLWGDLSWSTTFPKFWTVAAGSELVLNNTTTVEVNGDHSVYGAGTLRQNGDVNIGQGSSANPAFSVMEGTHIIDGANFISRGSYRVGSLATAAGGATTILTNDALLYVTATGGSTRVGDSANPGTNRLIINNSTFKTDGTPLYIPFALNSTGQVSQVGGLVSCPIRFGYEGACKGTYTIQNGTLETKYIEEYTNGVLSYMYFDNAVLRAVSGANSDFMSGLNRAEIQAGGLTIDAQADITIGQKLVGAGMLTKAGDNTLTLTNANTYSGGTTVSAGKLVLTTGNNYAGLTQVADGAELAVLVDTPGTTLTNGSLTLGSSGIATLTFDLGSFPNPTAPMIKTGTLTANGIVSVNVPNGLQLVTGPIVLVDYDGTIGGLGFDAFVLANHPNIDSAELVNNTNNSSIDLVITGVAGLLWTGAESSIWDYPPVNWRDQATGSPTTYSDGYLTEFRDGAATGVVDVVGYPYPGAIVVSNDTLPYVWNYGAITTPLLRKNGPGSVTRVEGEADAIGEIELNDGSYVFINSYDTDFGSVLTDTTPGLGTFVKRGIGTLTMTAGNSNNTFTGTTVIEEGMVKLGNTHALGDNTATIIITNGGTLDVVDHQPKQPTIVSGAGVNGQGAIIDSTTSGAVEENFIDVTLAGDTTFGCPQAAGRWDIRINPSTDIGPGLKGNGYKLTKVGPGMVSVACQRSIGAATPYWRMNLGDILISEGNLAFAESLDLGNPSASLTVSPGAILQIYDLNITNPILRTITMTDARLNSSAASSDTNVINGGFQLTGQNTFWCNQSHLIVNGPMGGSGSLCLFANDPGTLLLNGTNTYPGDTTVTNGTIGGTGIIAGNLVMLGGTNAPGSDGVGTLTVNGNVTLAGATRMELDRSLSPNSDRLVVGGTLAFGGVLEVTLGVGAPEPQAGDVYQLFSKGSSTSFTAVSLPDLSGLPGDLSWNTDDLAVNGTISVIGAQIPSTIGTVSSDGSSFTLSGTGGIEGATYYVVTSPDAAAPLASWTPVETNLFGPGGTFSFTADITGGGPKAFFRVVAP